MIHKLSFSNFAGFSRDTVVDLRVSEHTPESAASHRYKDGRRYPLVVGIFGANGTGKTTILRAALAAAHFACGKLNAWESEEGVPGYIESGSGKEEHKYGTDIRVEFGEPESQCRFTYGLSVGAWVGPDGKRPLRILDYEEVRGGPNHKLRFARDRTMITPVEVSAELAPLDIRCDRSAVGSCSHLQTPLGVDMACVKGLLDRVYTNINGWHGNETADQVASRSYKTVPGLTESLYEHNRKFGLWNMINPCAGSRSLWRILPWLQIALNNGGVALIDGVDQNLSPAIVESIMGWFTHQSSNPLGTQLIFTANNPALADDMDRHQVLVCERKDGVLTMGQDQSRRNNPLTRREVVV